MSISKVTQTIYGELKGISLVEKYNDGTIKGCMLNEYNEIQTYVGMLIPSYQNDGVRGKYINSLSFYKNGNLKSIALQNISNINTKIGSMTAEYITFYENGALKRLFPLNGKLTGYWSEENEYELAKKQEIPLLFGIVKVKIICVLFYETGAIKSITLWPKERIIVNTSFGLIDVRIGLSVYDNGKLKSLEPAKPINILTPIGNIMAYNIEANGINGDCNSLKFNEDGGINSIVTSTDRINLVNKNMEIKQFEPSLRPSLFHEDKMDIVPLHIDFFSDKVRFNKKEEDTFRISDYDFMIIKNSRMASKNCNSCEGCNGCSS